MGRQFQKQGTYQNTGDYGHSGDMQEIVNKVIEELGKSSNTCSITMKRHYEKNTCVVNYNGTNLPVKTCKYSESCILELPTLTGYDFSGWTYTGDNGTSTKFQSGYDMKTIITDKTKAPSTTGCKVFLDPNWDLHIYMITYKGPEPRTNDSANPSTYTIESAQIDLKRPLKI